MKYLKERIQKRLKIAIESGGLSLEEQYALIDDAMYKLLAIGAINPDAVKKFDEENEKDDVEIQKILERKMERHKKAYEEILKL